MMTHILFNLPEELKTTVKILEDEIYNKYHPLNIEMICDNILMKFDWTDKQSSPRTSIEDEKSL